MALVYVIEEDAALREILVDALRCGGDCEVWGFGSVDEAASGLSQQSADLVISELHLAGRSGLDMLAELERYGLMSPVIFMSQFLEDYGPYLPQRDNMELLAKPFDLEVLVEHVGATLQAWVPESNPQASASRPLEPLEKNEAGEAAPFGLFDYVQLSCVGGHTVEINVFDGADGGNLVGRVVVLGGELWSAQDAQGMGSDAFLRLASQPDTQVTCNALLQTSLARNIHGAWDALLLRAATLRDDASERLARGVDGDTLQAEPWAAGPVERPTFAGPPAGYETGQIPMPAGQMPAPAPEVAATLPLDAYIQAANQAEDAGQPDHALAYLEQAAALYTGHPEILLAVMRLRESLG